KGALWGWTGSAGPNRDGTGIGPGEVESEDVEAGADSPMAICIPSGLIKRIMTRTPSENVTRPTKGWKTLMATDSPHSLPAKKMKVILTRLIAHSNPIPPASHRSFLTAGPRTMAANADPTSRKPTTPFTPEHADTTLRAKVDPWCVTTKSVLSNELAGLARC